jgi:alpha-glucosidase
MRFWLDEGVDGFRLDVVNWFMKDKELRSNPWRLRVYPDLFQRHIYDRNRPETHEICREMRALADAYGDRLLVGEVFDDDAARAAAYHGPKGDELHLAFNFEFLFQPWKAQSFRDAARRWYRLLPAGAWPNFTLSNHDQPRHASRYGRGSHGEARARVAAAMLLTIRGTPFLYYGEEIGMRNRAIPRRHLQDPLGRRTWPLPFGRDGARTPMQWSGAQNAGFSDAAPWLPLNTDYPDRNVAAQRRSVDSLFTWYRRLIALRRRRPALTRGEIAFLPTAPGMGKQVLGYLRYTEDELLLVCLNFAPRRQPFDPTLVSVVLDDVPTARAPMRGVQDGPLNRNRPAGAFPQDDLLTAELDVLIGTHRGAGSRLSLRELVGLAADEVLVAAFRY